MSPVGYIVAMVRKLLSLHDSKMSKSSGSRLKDVSPIEVFVSFKHGCSVAASWWNTTAMAGPADRFDQIFSVLLRESERFGSNCKTLRNGDSYLVHPDQDVDPRIDQLQRGAVLERSKTGLCIQNGFRSLKLFVVRPNGALDRLVAILEPKERFSLSPGDRVHVGLNTVIYCPTG